MTSFKKITVNTTVDNKANKQSRASIVAIASALEANARALEALASSVQPSDREVTALKIGGAQ